MIQVIHKKQKKRTKHCKCHHKLSRKGYIGLEAELMEKKIIVQNEKVDRKLLGVKPTKTNLATQQI